MVVVLFAALSAIRALRPTALDPALVLKWGLPLLLIGLSILRIFAPKEVFGAELAASFLVSLLISPVLSLMPKTVPTGISDGIESTLLRLIFIALCATTGVLTWRSLSTHPLLARLRASPPRPIVVAAAGGILFVLVLLFSWLVRAPELPAGVTAMDLERGI